MRQTVLRDKWRGLNGKSHPVFDISSVNTQSLEPGTSVSLLFRNYSEMIATEVPYYYYYYYYYYYVGA
jgi:hypothetical protein